MPQKIEETPKVPQEFNYRKNSEGDVIFDIRVKDRKGKYEVIETNVKRVKNNK